MAKKKMKWRGLHLNITDETRKNINFAAVHQDVSIKSLIMSCLSKQGIKISDIDQPNNIIED